ncbi:hypothetical protein [Glaciibacter superstes]|uniref:hypothetical protein n=1 Tax=Glaciibacter superstes TaxID=501023 RepID=UPI0003B43E71|nr:hypothetical protein [Glaciibacter superstes]
MSIPIEIDDAIVLLLGAKAEGVPPGEIKGVTRLEKLIFLLEKETSSNSWLDEGADFEAYNFGPFSQKVYQAVDKLSVAGLVTDSGSPAADESDTWEERNRIDDLVPDPYTTRDFELTERGWRYFSAVKAELPPGALDELETFKERFVSLPLRQLVRYVYQRYDEFTKNSVIRDDILGIRR